MKKSGLLDWLKEEYQQFEAFLDQIGPARLEQPGVAGPWSVKDIVAHLDGWNRHLVAQLQAANLGQPEPPPPWPTHLQTEDEINAWIYAANQGRSLDEVLDHLQQGFQQLLAVIESLPDDIYIDREWHLVWFGDRYFPAGEFFDHFHDDHEPDIRTWLANQDNNLLNLYLLTWKTALWKQFGAAIDMLDNALQACPDTVWHARLWENPSERPEYSQFWYLSFHTLFWLDLYLSGAVEGFAPPAPFTLDELDPAGLVPEKPYTKEELRTYLAYSRQKCQTTIDALTDVTAHRRCRFPWGEVTFLELLSYNMRHVQEHAAQLNLMLGQKGVSAPGWVGRARNTTGG